MRSHHRKNYNFLTQKIIYLVYKKNISFLYYISKP